MTSPNRQNIDQWLFDYLEGNLSPAQEQQLNAFLAVNPDLETEMDAWSNASVVSAVDFYPEKEKLKKDRLGIAFWMSCAATLFLFLSFIGAYFVINSGVDVKTGLSYNQSQTNQAVNQNGFISNKNLTKDTENQNNLKVSDNEQTNSSNNKLVNKSNQANNNKKTINAHTEAVLLASQSTKNQSFSNSTNWKKIGTLTTTTIKETSGTVDETVPEAIFNGAKKSNDVNVKSDKSIVASSENKKEELSGQDLSLNKSQMQLAENSSLESIKNTSQEAKLNDSKEEKKEQSHTFFKNFSKKVKKMTQHEVALRNLRDPNYIIPGLTQRDINFASTGGLMATRVQTLNRVQWAGVNGQSVDLNVGVDGYVQALHGGLGMQVKYSNYGAGTLQSSEVALTYSPKFTIGKNKNFSIEPAVRFKMGINDVSNGIINSGKQIEWSRNNIQTFSQLNTPSTLGNRLWYKDIGLGLMLNAKWFFVGVNLDNIGRHNANIYGNSENSFARAPLNFTGTMGTDYESVNKKVGVSTYFVYQNYGKLSEGWLGANFRYQWLTVGGAVSTSLAPAASIGVKFTHFMLTYSMDYAKNHLQDQRYLSYQLSLRFVTKQNRYGRKLMN